MLCEPLQESTVQWLPAVGPSGQNLVSPPTEPELVKWWKGPTVMQAIDTFTPRDRAVGEMSVNGVVGSEGSGLAE